MRWAPIKNETRGICFVCKRSTKLNVHENCGEKKPKRKYRKIREGDIKYIVPYDSSSKDR